MLSQEQKNGIFQEQIWFAATTIGINGLLISLADKFQVELLELLWIGFLNVMAIYLIVHRSATYADKPKNLVGCIKHVPTIIKEFSGSLFYILVIITSFIGVFIISYCHQSYRDTHF